MGNFISDLDNSFDMTIAYPNLIGTKGYVVIVFDMTIARDDTS